MTDFAIHYHPDAYSLRGKVMGRQSAGTAFIRAVANSRPSKIWCYASSRADAQDCAETLASNNARTGVSWIPFSSPARLSEAGLLYRPDPVIDQEAWRRLNYAHPRAYSLCGVTHTIASHGPMTVLANLPLSPLEPWDAVICTSRAVRDSVKSLIESQIEYLSARIGASRFSLPQLPLIPLGVHCSDYNELAKNRTSARNALGVGEDEIVVIFVGRLSFHGKAHPAPLYLALESCAKHHKVTLIQAGWFANEAIERAFKEDAKLLCPSVRCMYIDARDQSKLKDLWSSADIFTSLSDNIQETFGLTPIEAMAAGLPVIVSDWDGYKDTVRDGIDGFRIPTLTLPPGEGEELADRFDTGLINYDMYCGYASQLVAVDVSQTTTALKRLMDDPDLRRQMGAAGRARATNDFDWSVIFRRYTNLWDELSERRRSDPQTGSLLTRRRRPDRPDPFTLFASYPTYHNGSGLEFRIADAARVTDALLRTDLATINFAKPILPPPELIAALCSALGPEWMAFDDLVKSVPKTAPQAIASAVVWLSKVGVLDFRKQP